MLNVNDPHVQEACFHVLRFLVLGSEEQRREIAREILLAATEFMCRSEDSSGTYATTDDAQEKTREEDG